MADNDMKKEEFIKLRTFAQTWDFDYVFYGVGDFQLPFPVTMTQVLFFGIGLGISCLFSAIIPPLQSLGKPILWGVIPFLIMKGCTSLDIDGKPPHMWIFRQIVYLLFQPKRLCKFRKVEKYNEFSFNDMKPIVIKGK